MTIGDSRAKPGHDEEAGVKSVLAGASAKGRVRGLCDRARRREPPISVRYPKALPPVQAWLPPPPVWRNAALFPDSLQNWLAW